MSRTPSIRGLHVLLWVALGLYLLWTSPARGGIQHTKHNLSASSPNTIRGGVNEICVYCHTPHQANPTQPLWNHTLSSQTYTLYASGSLNANLNQPNGYSRLCLSCHDGTVSIGSVYNLPGSGMGTGAIPMQGTTAEGKMPAGVDSGGSFSRNLGTALTNDHPISFVFNSTVSNDDGELVNPANLTEIIRLYPGSNPSIRDSVQCTSCHDPHNSGLPKFVKKSPLGQNDNLCITCHKRPGEVGKAAWQGSIHQESLKIPTIGGVSWGDTVANTACMNCHYPHNQGPPRLLRDSKQQGVVEPGIEQTCYRCHNWDNRSTNENINIPDIQTEFNKTYKMPIDRTSHVIQDGNLFEGIYTNRNDTTKRHVECPDCHNPHRVMKNSRYDGSGTESPAQRTHSHSAPHSNTASGALKGMWGVDPDPVSAWTQPTSFTEHKTYPNDLVTKEYQVCLKCHSYYGFGNNFPTVSSPSNGVNGLTQLTDQALEFNPSNPAYHPVIKGTGLTLAARAITTSPWLAPWSSFSADKNVGQTMYCTDCHGPDVSGSGTTVPTAPTPNGPHGSENPFLLKGLWNNTTGNNNTDSHLCFKCHDMEVYAPTGSTKSAGSYSGYCCVDGMQLHYYHKRDVPTTGGTGPNFACMRCHSAVPHGWKKRRLLVEHTNAQSDGASQCSGCPADPSPYRYAYPSNWGLDVIRWRSSGQWGTDAFNNCDMGNCFS